ncbi:MAG: hypothetical protein GY737_01925 [Desulfobacteraceae bacterium]|nr:hypothetical protein [Desulfobacteraceae bacterium]
MAHPLFKYLVIGMCLFAPRISLGNITSEFGGQAKLTATVTTHHRDSIQALTGENPWHDASARLRIKNRTGFTDTLALNVHYIAAWEVGNSLEWSADTTGPDNTGTGFMDLDTTLCEGEKSALTHGLDRLALEFSPAWGNLTLGRQAVTWGNGLLFNPMDMVNAFSPSDITRDYKTGADMVHFRSTNLAPGEMELLFRPGRDPDTNDPGSSHSSFAAKLHLTKEAWEIDLMIGSIHEDRVAGIGISGFVEQAAWRMDMVYTRSGGTRNENFLSLVVNIDRSWTWFDKNWYGFVEYFHSGVGSGDYARIAGDPDIRERVRAGELFTLGRHYLGGHLNIELHPLVNAFVTAINNVEDPSGLVQPRVVWNAATDLEVTLGGAFHYGARGTEFGGFPLPMVNDGIFSPGDSLYFWVTRFF